MKKSLFRLALLSIGLIALLWALSACGHEHVYGEWSVKKEATCTENGRKVRVCECGEKETKSIPAKNHIGGEWITDAEATCAEAGSKRQVCPVCNATISTKSIPSTEHTAGAWITDLEATCDENGSRHQACSVCNGSIQTETVPATGHTAGAWITDLEATCDENGSRHQACSVCNGSIQTETTPATGHVEGEWIIDLAATCDENGSKHQACSVCNESIKTEIIPATGHTAGAWITDLEATRIQDGSKHQVCSVCNDSINTEVIPATGFTDRDFYEVYYVDPATVSITANGQPKNLIYICLESMESGFTSKDNGGLQNGVNYIPNLTQLAKDNLSFSNGTAGQLGGFYTFEGATSWTMGALYALTSGLPFNFPVSQNAMSSQKYFAPGITNLGDILEDFGYNSVFLCGSDAKFGGRKNYFTQHGNYLIYDLYTARYNGDLPSEKYYNGFWGFEDKFLYTIAKNEITRLASEGEPFNMTLLTVDTHFPQGYQCSECGDTYDRNATYDGNMRNVLLCADHQVMEFINWCKEQDFYEDTVIIVSGDHPFMSVNAEMVKGHSMNSRPVYNCFINSAVEASEEVTTNRLFTSMDMFPTTLAAMGFNIEGNQLAMGVNLFSGQQTVIEQTGYDIFAAEIIKPSDYYNEFTGFNAANGSS